MSTYRQKPTLLGANVRAGFTPGGFTQNFGAVRAGTPLPRKRPTSCIDVKAAAVAALARRGVETHAFSNPFA